MHNLKQIFDQLQATNGRIEKENILKANANNETFQKTLYFLLNPFITTGLSTKKINRNVGCMPNVNKLYDIGTPKDTTVGFINLLEYIKKNNTGKDIDISACEMYFTNFDNEMQDFIKSILTKSLKVGIDAVTVNKIYGDGFIPVFDVMLGTSIEKCKIPENTYFYLSHKLNGSRALFYKGDLYTRSGKKYTGVEHIINDLKRVLINSNIVVDGELIRKNIDNKSDSENFQIGCGIANSKAETKEELKLVIFDIITANDFENGKSKLTYSERKAEIKALRETIWQLNIENLSVVDMFYEGTDQTQIWKWLDYAEEHDLEGVIVNLDAPYECKRTKNLIKVKKFYTLDLQVIGYEEGSGRLSGNLGSLVVDFKGNNVKVGSGFDDNTRKELWNMRDELIGRVIEIKYKEVSKDKKTGLESLQFPIYICLRDFGKEVSYD